MLATAARVGIELGRLGADLVRNAPELEDPALLTRLLGRPVEAARRLGGTSGTTDRVRLALTGEDLPPTVFVKTSAVAAGTRLFGGLARLGEVEVGFYRDLRLGLDLEAPQLLGASFDRWTGRFVLVLEDLGARGAEFVDTRTPLTPDRAAAGLSTLARLHGATHDLPMAPPWLGTNAGDGLLPVVCRSLGPLAGRVGDLVTTEGREILASYRRWAPVLDRGPRSVLHGDPHPGNIYLLGDGVGLLDWQAVRLGNGLRDVTYHLVLGLPPDVRREHERGLLDHYRERLRAAGGPDLDPTATWLAYRRMAGYAYVAAIFTLGLGGLQDDAISDVGARRAATAIADLETAAALG